MIDEKKIKWESNTDICIDKMLKDDFDWSAIPDKEGIYRVVIPDGKEIIIGNSDIRVNNPLNEDFLIAKHNHHKSKILYIGKAGQNSGLRRRLKQYMERNNHKGGRAIWQIKNYGDLLIQYHVCESQDKNNVCINCSRLDTCTKKELSEKMECSLLINFYNEQFMNIENGRGKRFYYPFANFKR